MTGLQNRACQLYLWRCFYNSSDFLHRKHVSTELVMNCLQRDLICMSPLLNIIHIKGTWSFLPGGQEDFFPFSKKQFSFQKLILLSQGPLPAPAPAHSLPDTCPSLRSPSPCHLLFRPVSPAPNSAFHPHPPLVAVYCLVKAAPVWALPIFSPAVQHKHALPLHSLAFPVG